MRSLSTGVMLKKVKKDPVPIQEAVDEYLKRAKELNKRARTIEDLRYRLNIFCSKFGDRKIDSIDSDDIDKWLKEQSRLFIDLFEISKYS